MGDIVHSFFIIMNDVFKGVSCGACLLHHASCLLAGLEGVGVASGRLPPGVAGGRVGRWAEFLYNIAEFCLTKIEMCVIMFSQEMWCYLA